MSAALYGAAHPYGYTELGTEASNTSIGSDDLKQFWSQNFVPNNAALIVSGQVTMSELRPLVEKAFADWQKGTPSATTLPVPATTSARLEIVDKPGAPQTQLRVATIGVPRATPDYAPIRIMNDMLGGLFSSRINLNLREEHGYTYGASSQFVFRRAAGPFVVGTGVRTDVTAPAVSEILKELKRMRETNVTDDELTLAKDSFVRSLPADFETSAGVNASTANIYVYDLGLDYYTKLGDRISAVNADQVKAVSQKYLPLDKMVVIAVGDRAKIGSALEKLKIGPVEARQPDGTLAAPARSTSAK
jgi:zinc protease